MTESTTGPAVTGFHHFSATVSDAEASAQWYERVFGMNRVPVTFPHYGAEEEGYAVLLIDPRSGQLARRTRNRALRRNRRPG